MTFVKSPNALVVKSNIAQPIPKMAGAPNPGIGVLERLKHYERKTFFPGPAEFAHNRSFIMVPDEWRDDPFYGVYGFAIPDEIKLRIVSAGLSEDKLAPEQREISERIARLGRGITLTIDSEHADVSMGVVTTNKSGHDGPYWNVSGIATSDEIDMQLNVDVQGLRGHRIQPRRDNPVAVFVESIGN